MNAASPTTSPTRSSATCGCAHELRKLVEEFGAGMAEKQAADPGRLLAEAVALLASLGLVARVDGGMLVLPLLARLPQHHRAHQEPARRILSPGDALSPDATAHRPKEGSA